MKEAFKKFVDWFAELGEGDAPAFKPEWQAIIQDAVPLYKYLPEALRLRLHQKIAYFIKHTHFEGGGGLELTDEMVLSVAAQACVLIMNKHQNRFPLLRSVLLYPSAFTHGASSDDTPMRLGESWDSGTVILSWNSVKRGARDVNDGQNVTFHEFAHQLDSSNGPTDGAPPLPTRGDYVQWARVLSKDFAELQEDAENRRKSLLDHYGASSPEEFFAVATEVFFEQPSKLRSQHPELYQEFVDYYEIDPAETFSDVPRMS